MLQDQPWSDLTNKAWIVSSKTGFSSLNFTTVVFSSELSTSLVFSLKVESSIFGFIVFGVDIILQPAVFSLVVSFLLVGGDCGSSKGGDAGSSIAKVNSPWSIC